MSEGIGSSWCFSPEWFGPGNKPCSLSSPRRISRWHRQGFKLYWKYKSKAATPKPKVAAETVALIQEMAVENRLWGAERIRGELLKLGLRVCKRTIQKYMRQVRTTRPRGQNWATFLHNHAEQIWACDFLPVTDLLFRSLFAFFIIDLHSRKVIHIGCAGYLAYLFQNLWLLSRNKRSKEARKEVISKEYTPLSAQQTSSMKRGELFSLFCQRRFIFDRKSPV